MIDLNTPPPPIPLNPIKRGRGRPEFVPTAEQRMTVKIMYACGMPHPQICSMIVNPATQAPIDDKTLRKVFRAELDSGLEVANGLVAQSLFKKATGSGPQSVTACIFWLKARAGWKDKQVVEFEGMGTAPAAAAVKDLSEDEFRAECDKYGIAYEPPAA